MQKTIDVLIFGGQSNMQGQTEALPEPNPPVENAVEYRLLTDSLIPLQHPVGEDIGDSLLLGAACGRGSLIPDFCRAYTEATNHHVVAIHAARGATTVSQWVKGTNRYTQSIQKILAGIEKTRRCETVNKIYYIWLQGESDAIERTSTADYMRMLSGYKNDLKQAVGIDKFCIIEVGYFCGSVTWLHDRTRDEGRICDEAIMQAQEQLPLVDDDFVVLTQICKQLSLDSTCINPHAQGHYNNCAMTKIGTAAGIALAKLQKY